MAVNVTTDKDAYRTGDTIHITVTVTDNSGQPLAGAAVAYNIVTASNRQYSGLGITGTDGKAHFQLKTKKPDGTGTYVITATADKTGYEQGTGTKTVQVD